MNNIISMILVPRTVTAASQQLRNFRKMLWPLCAVICLLYAGAASASEYHGTVTFNNQPMPGAQITARRGNRTFATVSDINGFYSFADLSDGTWTIEVQMPYFEPVKQDVIVSKETPSGHWAMKMLTPAEVQAQEHPMEQVANPAAVLSLPGAPSPNAPPAPGGSTNNTPAAAMQDDDQRAADGFLINGSVNNAATSVVSLDRRFGNDVRRPNALYNSGLSFITDNSALDASPYSLTGVPASKPVQHSMEAGVTFGGPLRIPHIVHNGPNFFIGYQWTRNTVASTQSTLVPDAAERQGNFSNETNAAGQPYTVYDPVTGLPYVNDTVPISPQAEALLALYPLANVTGNPLYNYQTTIVSDTHQDMLQLRLNRDVTPRDQLFGDFALQSDRSANPNVFHFVDNNSALGLLGDANWSHRFGSGLFARNLFMTVGYHFSRLRNQVQPQFENVQNISGMAGITGNNQSPANWGPPTLQFSSGLAGLTDANSLFNRNQTDAESLQMFWSFKQHYLSFGGDLRRRDFNYFQEQNPRGTFIFTGAATGSDLADFLIGVPDASALNTGNPDKYLRQWVYDAYFSDDWRLRPDLTITAGLRWEYGAPITELKQRLVNLDIASDFAQVAPVLASSPYGPLTGQQYPHSLIRPDKMGLEPRVALAWRPIASSSLVVRAGYGVYDDTSVYQNMALMMAEQAPLATSLSVSNSATCPLTLADGFMNCPGTTPQVFAVDPNFRVGYAQTWQLSLQHDLPAAVQMMVSYLGIKGTRGPQEILPNTYPAGGANPCPGCPLGFAYLASYGNSTREAGSMQLRRRLRNGLSAAALYTYSKSIDDDSTLGGQGPISPGATSQTVAPMQIAQNWRDPAAERGLSTFDQRHLLTSQLQYTTGMGLGGGNLLRGWKKTAYREWTVTTLINYGSGLPQTPYYAGVVPQTAYADVLRASVTGADIYAMPPGLFLNPAAFTPPPAGQFGNARKDSITGPRQFTMNASLLRTFRLREKYNLDARMDATNVLNHVTYTGWITTVGSTLFGTPLAANEMRRIQIVLRLRF